MDVLDVDREGMLHSAVEDLEYHSSYITRYACTLEMMKGHESYIEMYKAKYELLIQDNMEQCIKAWMILYPKVAKAFLEKISRETKGENTNG